MDENKKSQLEQGRAQLQTKMDAEAFVEQHRFARQRRKRMDWFLCFVMFLAATQQKNTPKHLGLYGFTQGVALC